MNCIPSSLIGFADKLRYFSEQSSPMCLAPSGPMLLPQAESSCSHFNLQIKLISCSHSKILSASFEMVLITSAVSPVIFAQSTSKPSWSRSVLSPSSYPLYWGSVCEHKQPYKPTVPITCWHDCPWDWDHSVSRTSRRTAEQAETLQDRSKLG